MEVVVVAGLVNRSANQYSSLARETRRIYVVGVEWYSLMLNSKLWTEKLQGRVAEAGELCWGACRLLTSTFFHSIPFRHSIFNIHFISSIIVLSNPFSHLSSFSVPFDSCPSGLGFASCVLRHTTLRELRVCKRCGESLRCRRKDGSNTLSRSACFSLRSLESIVCIPSLLVPFSAHPSPKLLASDNTTEANIPTTESSSGAGYDLVSEARASEHLHDFLRPAFP